MFKVVLEVSFKPFFSAETAIKAKTAEKSKHIKPMIIPELFKRNSLLTLSTKKTNLTSIQKQYPKTFPVFRTCWTNEIHKIKNL
ncbi:MAG: hypothetical protein DSY47_06335 [Hydrogenothermus sp.]|nr:MAG: hypothetical protein DSY47_06335 [Hydrogenothermus sp.]